MPLSPFLITSSNTSNWARCNGSVVITASLQNLLQFSALCLWPPICSQQLQEIGRGSSKNDDLPRFWSKISLNFELGVVKKGRTIFRGLLNPFGLYIIHWVAKYSVGKWLNCWGMKTCWGQHSSTAGCPRAVHARFGEGLMCIMMSTSRLTLTPIICIPYCTIKEITTAWWMVCRKGENSFPKWFWRNQLQLALMIFSLSDKHGWSHRWSQSYTS